MVRLFITKLIYNYSVTHMSHSAISSKHKEVANGTETILQIQYLFVTEQCNIFIDGEYENEIQLSINQVQYITF